MGVASFKKESLTNLPFYEERVDLACAFRWTVRLNMHEAVANHFSLAVSDDGSRFLMNPNQVHFSRIKASDLLLVDANDPDTLSGPDAPDPTAWGLHGSIHRNCPHARCVMHVHSIHATVLASLADSRLPPIDQNSAMFFNRHVVDAHYGGLAFEEEGEFDRIVGGLAKACKRWPGGIYALWYPIKNRKAVAAFREALRETGIPKLLDIVFEIRPSSSEPSLDGTGMVVVNPPFTLEEELRALLPVLHRALAAERSARWTMDWLAGESA